MFNKRQLETIKICLVFGLVDTAYTYIENRFNREIIYDDFHEFRDNLCKLSIVEILDITHALEDNYKDIENILKPYGLYKFI